MRTYLLTFIVFSLHLSILPGCTPLPTAQSLPQNQTVSWQTRAATLAQIKNWNLNGLIAMRSSKDAFSAQWQWQQTGQHYTMLLTGPLGANAARLTGTPQHVLLATADGKKFTATDPESLLTQQLGWQLPVSSLYYWIRGLPVMTLPAQKKFDAFNHLLVLNQQGWTIQYVQYLSIRHIDLPSKIILTHPALQVKVIIKQWQI